MNTFKSTLLLVGLTLILVFVGDWVGGQNGMILAFVISVAMNFCSERRTSSWSAVKSILFPCHNPICLDARSFMISSVPPPIALTFTSR